MLRVSTNRPSQPRLRKNFAPSDPFSLFQAWLQAAIDAGVLEPTAMTLATVSLDGKPAARMVIMRNFDQQGFCFYTDYQSRKGRELTRNPNVALIFWWPAQHRQVRVEGVVKKLSATESDDYYHSRPLDSRLGAWVSPQSQIIPNIEMLEMRLSELRRTYAQKAPLRPPSWGGYRVRPNLIEFWQSGPHRLHDRLCYFRESETNWRIERLAP